MPLRLITKTIACMKFFPQPMLIWPDSSCFICDDHVLEIPYNMASFFERLIDGCLDVSIKQVVFVGNLGLCRGGSNEYEWS